MGSNFKMNPNFEREIKREIKRGFQQKVRKVSDRYQGRPIAEVDRALEREGIPEPPRSQIAEAISEGKELRFE